MDKIAEIFKHNPELALAIAMVLKTEYDDVHKAYLDVLEPTVSAYDQQAIFNKHFRTVIEELKDVASSGMARRKRPVVHKQEL